MKKLFLLAAMIVFPNLASAQSVWMHNRSEMLLEARSDGTIIITYLTPREGLSAQPGDFVIYGSIGGVTGKNSVSGIARIFSAKCGPAAYEVGGNITDDKKTINLTGNAPIRDANCKITRFKEDKLLFTYVGERGNLDTSFIGEWSENKTTCNEEEAKEGPILTNISPRGYGAYETYCAFSQIKGDVNQASITSICTTMGNRYSINQDFKKIGHREIEIITRDGPSAGAKQSLYKCPIPLKDASLDPSTPANIKHAEEEYFNDLSAKSHEVITGTMYNWPKSGGKR